MNRIFRRGKCLLLGVALAASSAGATKISDLETQLAAFNARLDQVEQREENYRKDLEASKKSNQDLALELKKGQADLKLEIQNLRQELSQLEEAVREISSKLSMLEEKLTLIPQQGSTPALTTASSADTTQLAAAEAQTREAPAGTAAAKPASPSAGIEKSAKTASEGYELGVKYFNAGNYDAAAAQFTAFLKANPGSKFAEDAQFKTAECYYELKDYKRAVLEYDQFQKKFPKSPNFPASMLKMGLCFEKQGKKDVAETIYKDLIATYPKSTEAAQARNQLNKLTKK